MEEEVREPRGGGLKGCGRGLENGGIINSYLGRKFLCPPEGDARWMRRRKEGTWSEKRNPGGNGGIILCST